MADRIEWKKYFDMGYTPAQIATDSVLFPWYSPKKKGTMYRAYREWKAKKKKEILTSLPRVSESQNNSDNPPDISPVVVDNLPINLNDALNKLVDEMTLKITKSRMAYKCEAIELARRLIKELQHDPTIRPSDKIRLLEVLVND